MRVYQIRFDGEDRLYAANSLSEALQCDYEHFVASEPLGPRAVLTGKWETDPLYYTHGVLDHVSLVGELCNLPTCVICGCTPLKACSVSGPGISEPRGCSWVLPSNPNSEHGRLCNACLTELARRQATGELPIEERLSPTAMETDSHHD